MVDGAMPSSGVEGISMPLSEHEQKILADLEESLSKQDAHFAKKVGDINLDAGRKRALLGIVSFVIGFAIFVASFTQSPVLGLIGLAVMIGSSLVLAFGADQAWNAARSRSGRN